MDLGEHRIRFGLGEKPSTLDRRQLRRIAKHQQRHFERHQVARELGIHHGAFVDDDELSVGSGRLAPKLEGRVLLKMLLKILHFS